MFTSDMSEAKDRVISIKEVECEALKSLLLFCYTGCLDMDGTNVEDLLRGACLLQLPEVVNACSDFLTSQLHATNCLGFRQFAEIQNCHKLHRAAHDYALANFTSVVKTDEFLLLDESELFNLLSSDLLNVSNEIEVFEALRHWLYHDGASRDSRAGRLLQSVRLTLLSPHLLADRVETDPVFAQSPLAQSLLVQAYKYHLLTERRDQMSLSCSIRPRISTIGCVFVIAGGNAHRGSVSIERYDPMKDIWCTVGEMSGRRLQFGVAVIQQKVHVVGGRDGLKTLNSFDTWEPDKGQWQQLPPMMTPRHGLGVAVLEDALYACGGHDGWAYLCSVERWDPETNSWSFVAEMKAARNTAGVAVLDSRVYAIGGRDSGQVLRSVERYNPHTNKWTEVASMNRRRGNVGVGVLNGFIYAVGGMDAPASNPGSSRFDCVERYDPKTDRWTLIASLSCGRDGVSVCALGDQLLAIGGFDGQNYLSVVEMYDPEQDVWNMLAPLRNGRAGSGVVVLPASVCVQVNSTLTKMRPSTSALLNSQAHLPTKLPVELKSD